MTPERLAEIEKWAEENKRGYYEGTSAKTILELVAALREAQQNQLDTERTYVRLRDFHDTQMEAARAECDALAATLERVRAVVNEWTGEGSSPDANGLGSCVLEALGDPE